MSTYPHPPPIDFIPPPPPYSTTRSLSSTPRVKGTITTLPLHILHRILSLTLDPRATPSKYDAGQEEEVVRRVWAMFRGLRGVDRRFYLVSISILRNRFLHLYTSLLQRPISSDPFPQYSQNVTTEDVGNVFEHRSRETAVYDRFIAIRVGEELRTMESELCEASEGEREIFARLQPQARVEDLLLSLPTSLISSSSTYRYLTNDPNSLTFPLPHQALSIGLTPQWAHLHLQDPGRKSKILLIQVRRGRTLDDTVRGVKEGLEDLRRGLVEIGGRFG